MIKKIAFAAAGLGISGLVTLGVAFAQSTSPSPTATPTATPMASSTTVPSAPPSTGMGGGN